MKLYAVSGLGADRMVLSRLKFREDIEVEFIDWLIPLKNEPFEDYVKRMAGFIDSAEPFGLLGYSFGGIIVQEINKLKPAQKVVIMGSIKSHKERSPLLKFGNLTQLSKHLPLSFFNDRSALAYAFIRRIFDPKNPKLLEYFRVRDPYYLKWSIEKIVNWTFEENPDVVQIMGDRDIVFPLKNSNPDFVIKNGTHLFPVTKHKEVSEILKSLF